MGSFVVSARKYRPVRFDEVVGQDHVVDTLKNALKTDHLAHAFLFCGPRGIGKTTCARILAKTINCEDLQPDFEACGKCASCKAFTENASFNIIELDAASHNSVEHIRALNEQVRFQPQQGKYKVFIIDEVHMLSQSAFNAFLKTLEEPPPYAIFILATTEKHKIIPTILSRCQIFDFRRIQVADIKKHLEHIAEQEEIKAEQEALITIAQKSDGALRDALSLYDRLVSLSGSALTYADVVRTLNILDYDTYFKIVDACVREDISTVLIRFDEILSNGFEADLFVNGLASHFRDLLVSKDTKTVNLLDHSEEILQRYVNQAGLLPRAYLFSALDILNTCDIHYPRANNKRLHVEMALGKICYLNRAVQVSPFSHEETDPGEKKTPESPVRKPLPEVENAPGKTPAEDDQKEEIQGQTPEPKSAPGKESGERKKPGKAGKAERTDDSGQGVPKIPVIKSIEDIQRELERAEKEAEENRIPVDIEKFQEFWETYLGKLDSPSLKNTLKHAVLSVKDGAMQVRVGTQNAKTRIQKETGLLEYLREAFHHPRVQMIVKVDPALDENGGSNGPKKPLSNKEKYDLLRAKNPHIQDLKNKFDLVVDHDE